MNLVGKIFTVLIFVMSLVFMAFTVMVYATHVNWQRVADNPKDKVTLEHDLGLSQQLTLEKQTNQELVAKNEKINADLEMEKAEDRQSRAKLETDNDDLATKLKAANDLLIAKSKEAADLAAELHVTNTVLANKVKQEDTLRVELDQARKDLECQNQGSVGEDRSTPQRRR